MKLEKLQNSRVKAIFDVTKEEFAAAMDKAFEVCNAKVTIKGFRAGKAPKSAYIKNYGVESLYDEALNNVLNNKVSEIYADKELAETILGQFEPAIEGEDKVDFENGFQVSLTFDVHPEVNLPQYKGIEITPAKTTATKKEIDAEIEAILKKDAQMVLKEEQVIEKMDYATFDFVGSVDGVEFPGGTAENYELQIGSKQFIPGFEDQMIGMKAGEVKDLDVKFPKNYQEKSLAGKKAVFKVTLHEVKVEKLPELTDEYVANLNLEGITTVKALKADKKAKIEAQKVISEKDRQVDEIINKILDNCVVEMPQTLINERINMLRAQYENQAKMYNIPFETFLGLIGTNAETFNAETEKQAKRQALFNVVFTKIVEVEKLSPSIEQVQAKAEEIAKAKNTDAQEVLKTSINQIFSDLAYTAVVEMLLANATYPEKK
ncbi:MAG: trigger factor [Acholeplasmatales bacterium]|nr:trigger factor [Acholeplasmatales bacterium]